MRTTEQLMGLINNGTIEAVGEDDVPSGNSVFLSRFFDEIRCGENKGSERNCV